MEWNRLNTADTNLYKGLAILLIVMHNFMHLMPAPKQLEFSYTENLFINFLDYLSDPGNFLQAMLSYFGHFGVQIFIFLSAYGLTKRYLNDRPIYFSYMWRRFTTIYPSFLLAILFWAITTAEYKYGVFAPLKTILWNFDSVSLKLMLLSNFFENERLALVGPWWFISFIFQFYFVFPALLLLYSRWNTKGLLVLSAVSILFTLLCRGEIAGINLYYTIVAHVPELCLGIFLAKKDHNKLFVPNYVIFTSIFVYLLGNIFEAFWYVSHISFLILLLAILKPIVQKIKSHNYLNRTVLFFGSISLPLFLVNGFTREPFITWAKEYEHWLITIALCIVSLCLSILIALILQTLEKYFRQAFAKYKEKLYGRENAQS